MFCVAHERNFKYVIWNKNYFKNIISKCVIFSSLVFFSTKFVKRRENLFSREHIQKTNLSKCPLSLLLVMEVIAHWKAKVHFLLDSWELSATLIGLVARIFVVVVWVTFHTDWKLSHATFPTSSKLRFIYLFICFFLFEFPNKKNDLPQSTNKIIGWTNAFLYKKNTQHRKLKNAQYMLSYHTQDKKTLLIQLQAWLDP